MTLPRVLSSYKILLDAPLTHESCTWQSLHVRKSFHCKMSESMAQRGHILLIIRSKFVETPSIGDGILNNYSR